MSEKIRARLQVRRTRVETTYVEIPIDADEFTEWSGGVGPVGAPYALVAQYVESDGEWPRNVEALAPAADSVWKLDDVEIELPR